MKDYILTQEEVYEVALQMMDYLEVDLVPEAIKSLVEESVQTVINSKTEAQLLRERIDSFHPTSQFTILKENDYWKVQFEETSEDYEDYIVRSLQDVYGYKAENHRLVPGLFVYPES